MKALTSDLNVSLTKFLAITLLVSGSLSWIFITYFALEDTFLHITSNINLVYAARAIYMGFGAIFALIGTNISTKVNRRTILLVWITLGTISTALLAVVQGPISAIFVSMLLGLSVGLGLPSALAFLADNTKVEERGRVAGGIILETFIIVTISVLAYSLLQLGVFWLIILSLAIRSTSYFTLALDPCKTSPKEYQKTASSWKKVLKNKDFALYLIPWFMFNIASGLIGFVWSGLPTTYDPIIAIGNTLHYLTTGVFGFIAGITADRIGRKQIIISGMILLGVSFAFLGLLISELSVLVYLILSGIAWGLLIVIYTAVPGDLSKHGSKEKYYALGAVIPFSIYFGITALVDFSSLSLAASAISSTLSIILFLSIIPVLKAAETLPVTKIKENKMRKYVDQVGKIIEESKNKQ